MNFGRRVAENLLGGRIVRLDGAVFVDGDDPVDHMVHDGPHPLLGLSEFFLGPLALGDVPDDAGEVPRSSPKRNSLMARSIGKVVPSLRRPVTSRPMPMIFACPVWR